MIDLGKVFVLSGWIKVFVKGFVDGENTGYWSE